MNWLQATYQPTTLFSLKPSWATSSGGKSLLLPSPYALKISLLDVAARVDGWAQAETAWPWLRQLEIGIRLPEQIVVTNLFAKILKIRRNPAREGSSDAGPFQKTIAYREYVCFSGAIHLAWGTSAEHMAVLTKWLLNLNYWGKRGGFVQLTGLPTAVSDLNGYILLTQEMTAFPVYGVMQRIDDCDPNMKLDNANIYTKSRPKRIIRDVALPYRLKKSSRSYSLYERLAE
jgi:hypothetical protein